MAQKKNSDAAINIDELLGSVGAGAPEDAETQETVAETPEVAEPEQAPEKTPDQLRIEELEAELAKPIETVTESLQDKPEKTPEQIRIEELEMKLAQRNAAVLENAPEQFETIEDGTDVIVFHVVQDGFTAFGRVWLRGQELRLTPKHYEETKDRHGVSWVDTLLNDQNAQYDRWGTVYIAPGPFRARPGEVFNDEVAREDERRKGAIPTYTR